MTKESKVKLMSGVVTLALATGIVLSSPVNAYAEGIQKPKQGTFIDNPAEFDPELAEFDSELYDGYVVKSGDSLSKISTYITKYFGEEISSKYWPVLADINGAKGIHPGDIIVFPETFEAMDEYWNELNANGDVTKYKKKYYRKAKTTKTVMELVQEIYSEYGDGSACVDPDFVRKYLAIQGLSGKYDIDSVINMSDGDQVFELTEWIPDQDEVENYKIKNKNKKR